MSANLATISNPENVVMQMLNASGISTHQAIQINNIAEIILTSIFANLNVAHF